MADNNFPNSGIIYIFEKADGTRVTIPVEQTPDDITILPTIKPPEPPKKPDPRDELSSIAYTPIPEKPKFDPFGMGAFGSPFGKPGAAPFPPFAKASGGMGRPGTKPFNQPLKPYSPKWPQPAVMGKPSGYKPLQRPTRPPVDENTNLNEARKTIRTEDKRPKTTSNEPKFISADRTPAQLGREENKFKVNSDNHPILEVPTPQVFKNQPEPDLTPEIPPPPASTPPAPSVVLPFAKQIQEENKSKTAKVGSQTQPVSREASASTFNPERPYTPPKNQDKSRRGGWGGGPSRLGMALIVLSLGGLTAPLLPKIRLETAYRAKQVKETVVEAVNPPKPLPPSAPVIFDPLINPDGTRIVPVNTDFALIVPKVGINAPVVANVNPAKPDEYREALKTGVAHAVTSYTPDREGTAYLFSHSTNYEWFIDDLNAIFYLLKELKEGDTIVVMYKGVQYAYKMTGSKVVKPNQVSYLAPRSGEKKLILQTCWPPGSVAERLLIFAELIDEQSPKLTFRDLNLSQPASDGT